MDIVKFLTKYWYLDLEIRLYNATHFKFLFLYSTELIFQNYCLNL